MNLMDMLWTGNDIEMIFLKGLNCGCVIMFVTISVHIHPGQYFMQSPLFCETAKVCSLHHFVPVIFFFRVLKIKTNLVK